VADLLAVAVPTFGWAEGRRLLASSGSAAEINRYLERRPEHAAEDVMVVLRYFDPLNFAGQVVCPALVGAGLVDPVVPAPTVLAIADHLGGPAEVLRFPVSHSGGPRRTAGRRSSGVGWSSRSAGSRTASGADQPAQPASVAASRTQSPNQGRPAG
jgi:cephalosporin-C deacetylase